MQRTFVGIRGFVGIVGVLTLLSGAFGVSNILLITVRERTAEIGLRRALGARRRSIVAMILREALMLTGVSGYAGLVSGVAVLAIAGAIPVDESDSPSLSRTSRRTSTWIVVSRLCLAGSSALTRTITSTVSPDCWNCSPRSLPRSTSPTSTAKIPSPYQSVVADVALLKSWEHIVDIADVASLCCCYSGLGNPSASLNLSFLRDSEVAVTATTPLSPLRLLASSLCSTCVSCRGVIAVPL